MKDSSLTLALSILGFMMTFIWETVDSLLHHSISEIGTN